LTPKVPSFVLGSKTRSKQGEAAGGLEAKKEEKRKKNENVAAV
jgi:hypothetical protein